MTEREYDRLRRLLETIAEKQQAVGDRLLKADEGSAVTDFACTEKALAELLINVKKRIGDQER